MQVLRYLRETIYVKSAWAEVDKALKEKQDWLEGIVERGYSENKVA